jgi:hypothetical protein
MNTLNNPAVRTYYIASEDGVAVAYGFVDPGQRLDSGATTFEVFTDENAYTAKLLIYGIQVDDLWKDSLPADITQAKLILRSRVDALRVKNLVLDITFLGHPFQTDPVAVQNLSGVIGYMGMGGPLPEGFCWRSSDNINVPMTPRVLRELAGTILAYRNAVYVHSWVLKAQLDAADDLSAFDVTLGWPDNTKPLG